MSWAEIKKALNTNLAVPLNTLITNSKTEILNLWNTTRASYLDHLYGQYANRGGYLDTTISSRQSEANAAARYNNLYVRMTPALASLTGEGANVYVGSTTNSSSQWVCIAKFIAPVSGVYKITTNYGGSSSKTMLFIPRRQGTPVSDSMFAGPGGAYTMNTVNTAMVVGTNSSGDVDGAVTEAKALPVVDIIGLHRANPSVNYFYCDAGEPVVIGSRGGTNPGPFSSIVISYQPR